MSIFATAGDAANRGLKPGTGIKGNIVISVPMDEHVFLGLFTCHGGHLFPFIRRRDELGQLSGVALVSKGQ